MAFVAVIMGLGFAFYILLGSGFKVYGLGVGDRAYPDPTPRVGEAMV